MMNNIRKQQALQTEKKVCKAYVGHGGKVAIMCPECKKAKIVSTAIFPQRKTTLKVRCTCSNVFKVYLDYRKSYRKTTDLVGTFKVESGQEQLVKINNLSVGGAELEVVSLDKLSAGQNGYIDFILNDKKRTRIHKSFSVEVIRGKKIGCKFKEDQFYDKKLSFYLRIYS